MDCVYKRPSKTTPSHAPGKEEKQETVKKMVQEILKIIDKGSPKNKLAILNIEAPVCQGAKT